MQIYSYLKHDFFLGDIHVKPGYNDIKREEFFKDSYVKNMFDGGVFVKIDKEEPKEFRKEENYEASYRYKGVGVKKMLRIIEELADTKELEYILQNEDRKSVVNKINERLAELRG